MLGRFVGHPGFLAACLGLGALHLRPAGAANPQPYTVAITRTGNTALDAAIEASSQLVQLRRTAPAAPFALALRAQQDIGRLQTALQSFGYYDGTVAVTVDRLAAGDPALPDRLAQVAQGHAVAVTVTPTPGPLFTLGRISVHGTLPPQARAAIGLHAGQPAVAADVLAAQARLQTALLAEGYALASVPTPRAYENPGRHTLDIVFDVTAGPRVDLGAIRLEGLHAVAQGFIRHRLLVHPGQRFSPQAIDRAQADLQSLGVFSSVAVHPARQLDAQGRLPLTFVMQERPAHTVSLNADYATDLGTSLGIGWSDRNVFGHAEQLHLGAQIDGFAGRATRNPGYDISARFVKPDWRARGQTLSLDVAALRRSLDTYDQTALLGRASLLRHLATHWTVSTGLNAAEESINQQGVTRDYTLLGLPLQASYDSTNSLLDPTRGVRLNLSATPTQSFGGRTSSFLVLLASASTYVDLADFGLGRHGRSVLALHALIGSIQGAGSAFALPPDQRFYAGGGGSVRGFKYQSIGPQFADGTAIGGLAVDLAQIEFRQKLWGNFAASVFTDMGQVAPRAAPFEGGLHIGAGVGLLYDTSVGPIRFDVAFPLTREPGGDAYEFYVGIGQAF
ncbi:MAG: BamA/TamA family outer membrane protein [Rhodospirillales bacterium]|nr:BamA/TamA family outer membrane protein [Rhodospirillales bacterium]